MVEPFSAASFHYWLPLLFLGVSTIVLIVALHRARSSLADVTRAHREEAPAINQLDSLVRMSADFLWQTDKAHRFVLFSDGAGSIARNLPETLDALRAHDCSWQVFPADKGAAFTEALLQNLPLRVTVKSAADGSERYIELTALPRSENGAFQGYLGVGRDISDRVEAEIELDESRARYQEVIDSIREVIFSTDDMKRLTFLNQAWEKITTRVIDECVGRSLLEYLHPDDRSTTETGLNNVLQGSLDEYHAQVRIHTPSGEIRWAEINAHRVGRHRSGDPGAALAGTLDDISTRKIAEMTLRNLNHELEARVRMRTAELEASNRELEAFSYSVSHDLRAPLRSIDGFARILEEDLGDRLDADARGHLERIRKAAVRMAHLIDNLIELARLTRHTLRKENVDLSELAIQIIDDLKADEPHRKVEVAITSDLMVTADRTLMQVVLDNLLRNAWKFSSRRDDACITFDAERGEDGRRVFRIADNGVGFDMAFATHLFRAFHRLHDNTDFPGTGIGLANVQRIIERHGGRIWAESAPDRGARFYFTLDP